MLHELLFALLGFPGDVIVEVEGSYAVRAGLDLLREAEREQINRLAPLGWLYAQISAFVDKHDVSWGAPTSRVYMVALVQGVRELLDEYVSDVSFLEQLVLAEGPVPLSQVLQHMQKYLLVLPKLHSLLLNAERSTQPLLDFFTSVNTGSAGLQQVLDRLVLRLRAVLVKQIFAWMVHGELEDPGNEFFVQRRDGDGVGGTSVMGGVGLGAMGGGGGGGGSTGALHELLVGRLYQAKALAEARRGTTGTGAGGGIGAGEGGGMGGGMGAGAGLGPSGSSFDWASSYRLSPQRLPAQVSPRIASKVVFAGKAVKLLQ
ncbi:gamma-tubulin complex component protein, partial [Ochromonadaceae sp. CCMP2298]